MADDKRKIQATVMLPKELHRRIKVRAAEQDRHMSDLLVEGARIVLDAKPRGRKRPADDRATA